MESNYEKQVFLARELFCQYDQQEMIRKLRLQRDEAYLYLELLGETYRVNRKDGAIQYRRSESPASEDDGYVICLDYQVVMTIYDVLCYPREMPVLSGQWCALHHLQVTMSSPGADTFNKKYAEAFAGKTKELLAVCKKIGGSQPVISAGADVCWQFAFFSFFPVQLRFWDGDEEFAPKIQLLWDRNSLKFMHFETVYYVMGHLLTRLKTELDTELEAE